MMQANQDRSEAEQPNQPKRQIAVKGCISRLSSHEVLEQAHSNNTYITEPTRTIDIVDYVGHQVEVAGPESHTAPPARIPSENRRQAARNNSCGIDQYRFHAVYVLTEM
jgi:hypothetical protein